DAGEAQSAELARYRIERDAGSRLLKGAATGVLHDVHQETACAAGAAVLVVDVRIDVLPVRIADELRGFVGAPFVPAIEKEAAIGAAGGKQIDRREVEQ